MCFVSLSQKNVVLLLYLNLTKIRVRLTFSLVLKDAIKECSLFKKFKKPYEIIILLSFTETIYCHFVKGKLIYVNDNAHFIHL